MEKSVSETFRNGTVLVTGSTGYLGKLLIEKLLRSCPVKEIAVLVRSKKGCDASKRIADINEQTLFNRLRREKPDFQKYIKPINGDLEDSSMNLTLTDRDWLIANVNFIFHCAATIKFNEPLRKAAKINIQGTENILLLAKEMKNLKGFVHVSTAYSHYPRNEIREQFYPVPTMPTNLGNIFDERTLLEDWPNTYCFTKANAENLLLKYKNYLPLSVFRPSIIGCTKSEPDPGWLEKINGPSGLANAVFVGFVRAIPLTKNLVVDIIPADYTVNAMICVMWDTVNRFRDQNMHKINQEPKIYNYVSSVERPITWGKYIEEMHNYYLEAPPLRSMWFIFYVFYTNIWIGIILRFLLNRIPAAFMDLLLLIRGKKTKVLKMYAKTELLMDLLRPFASKQWIFDNSNIKGVWSLLGPEDRNTFWFSFEEFDWKLYLKSYYYGNRKHLLHEDMSNITNALEKNQRLFWFHQLFIVILVYFSFKVFQFFTSCII